VDQDALAQVVFLDTRGRRASTCSAAASAPCAKPSPPP